MYPYSRANMDVIHILRGDKYVLLSIGRVGRVDLKRDFKTGWGPSRTVEKSLTIILMAMRRLTASMNTSNSSEIPRKLDVLFDDDHRGVPRQRIGLPMDSHIARSKQIVANDFSPPLSERGSLSRLPPWVLFCSSVWT